MIKFENKENGRYYYLHVEIDIFCNTNLLVTRGGIRSNLRPRVIFSGEMGKIEEEIARISRIRLQRGYTLVDY